MQSRARAGFTLIELMTAMTLTLVMMLILVQAFTLAMDTFTALKGLGDMQSNLRTASVHIRDDVRNDHFEGSRRLTDPTLVVPGLQPQAGFLVVKQGST